MDRGILIYNSLAGGANGEASSAKIVTELKNHGVKVDVIQTSAGEDPAEVAEQALERAPAFIIAAGGDGTIEAVAKVLIGRNIPLGVIACGTYNNFAKNLDLPSEVKEACRVIAQQAVRTVDVGFANGQPFFECAGFGLDAEVFPLGEEIKDGRAIKWVSLFQKAFRYPRQTFELEFDRPLAEAVALAESGEDRRWFQRLRRKSRNHLRIRALMITVSNGPFYGMNFAVAPEAQVDDGLITVSIFKRFSKFALWWHFRSISAGRRVYSPKTIRLRVNKITVNGNQPIRCHLDGRSFSQWPVKIQLRERALDVFR